MRVLRIILIKFNHLFKYFLNSQMAPFKERMEERREQNKHVHANKNKI
jgi:hypothetical protein